MRTCIVLPFASVLLLNVAATAPAFAPFSNHWYAGVTPPFTGVAVNCTLVPEQMAPAGFAAMVTDGVTMMLLNADS
jgi:hypothetical protein